MQNFYIWVIIFVAIMIFEFAVGMLRKRRQEADTSIDASTYAGQAEHDHNDDYGNFDDEFDDEPEYDFSGRNHDHSGETGRRMIGQAEAHSSFGRQSFNPSDMFPGRNSLNKSKGNKLFS